jgi:ABC-type uncharacterized transport system ATPase subunit
MADQALAIEMKGITKRFPGVLALDKVDFEVALGEIHALLGENGAGKSTLMSVLSGRLTPDEGSVHIMGRSLPLGMPRASIKAGVGMVYQHFKLAAALSVAENLLLGKNQGSWRLGVNQISQKVLELGEEFDLPVDPAAKLWQLSLGEWQRVEIIRLLLSQANILVLDEPTTILTGLETQKLFAALKRLKGQGKAVVFISHKLDEVLGLTDKVTVLTRGTNKACVESECTDKAALARLMIDSDYEISSVKNREPVSPGNKPPVLQLKGLTACCERGTTRLDAMDLMINPGEVLGVAGVAGNGQRELTEVCCGLRQPSGGSISINGKDLTGKEPRHFIEAGVGFVPEDRQEAGSVGLFNLVENLMLKDYQEPRFQKGIWLNWGKARDEAKELIKKYDVRPPDPDASAGSLSGGNLQKLLLAREVSRHPALIVAAYPLRGLDLASASFVQSSLGKFRDQGGSVMFIGEDLDALLEISDRMVVLFRGRIMGEFINQGLSMEKLGLLMAGEDTA